MLKKLLYKYAHAFAAITLLVSQLSANLACDGPFYQEKVPAQLLSNR